MVQLPAYLLGCPYLLAGRPPHLLAGVPHLHAGMLAGGTTGVDVRGRPIGDSLCSVCLGDLVSICLGDSVSIHSHLKGVYVL